MNEHSTSCIFSYIYRTKTCDVRLDNTLHLFLLWWTSGQYYLFFLMGLDGLWICLTLFFLNVTVLMSPPTIPRYSFIHQLGNSFPPPSSQVSLHSNPPSTPRSISMPWTHKYADEHTRLLFVPSTYVWFLLDEFLHYAMVCGQRRGHVQQELRALICSKLGVVVAHIPHILLESRMLVKWAEWLKSICLYFLLSPSLCNVIHGAKTA